MANEFIIRKGFKSLQDSELTGSLNLSGNIVADGTVQAEFASSTSTAISGAFDSVSSSLASELLKNTTDTLTGDLTVTGTLTAQEFHTEFTSASIVYESGSTQFGDSSDDTHIFSGSALVSGSIGIGTSSPDNGLHVKDTNIHLQASNAKIKLSDFDNSMYLRMNNTGSLEVTDSNEVSLVHFNKNGKVGIGTNSPAELLHLYSVSNSGPEIRFQHPSGSHYIRAYDNNWNFLADASVQAISIQNNGTTTFGANVLLGNTVVNPATGFADQSGIGLKESSTVPKIEVSSDDTALSLNRTTTGGAGVIADLRYESNVRHSFGTATSYMLGSVGIGTTLPAVSLHVNGFVRFNGGIQLDGNNRTIYAIDSTNLLLGTSNTEAMRIDSSGRVSINDTVSGNFLTNYDTKLLVGGEIIARSLTANESMVSIGGDSNGAFIKSGKQDGSLTDRPLNLITGEDIRISIASSGDVGIGTDSPASTRFTNADNTVVDITGALTNRGGVITLRTSDSSKEAFLANDGGILQIGMYTDNDIGLYTNNDLKMFIARGGNVGIGTTSPQTHLDVVSSGHTKFRVRTTGVADASMEVLGYDAGVHIGDATNGNRWAIWNDGVSTTSPLSFGSYALGTWYVPDSQVMTLTHDGNVGIGDTTPNARLHVSAPYPTYTDYGTVFYGGTTNNSSQNGIMLGSAGNALSGVIGSNLFIDGTTWSQTNTGRSTGWFSIVNTTVAGKTSGLYYRGYVKGSTSTVDRFSITENGNVLIGGGSEYSGTGVTSLTINNDSYPTLSLGSTSASRMSLIAYNSYNYLSSSNPFYFDTGKVGIGTTSASSVLQVHGQQKWYTTNADGNELRGFFNPGGSADPANFRLYDADGTNIWIDLYGDGRIYSKGLVTNWGTGTGTYTRTTYYHDTSNGLLFEGGRTTDSSTGTGITWKFTWRGGAGTGGGVQLVHGDSAWSALSSDERLKTKTADIENGLDAINALSPIKYKWNTDIGSESEREITGFTAQNVQSAIPDAVFASSQDEELGDILTYRQNYITAYLVKAVQELSAKNDQLQAEIDALKNA